jgi:tight adherence protein C
MTGTLLLAFAAVAAALAASLAATAVAMPPTTRERMMRILAEFSTSRFRVIRPAEVVATGVRPPAERFIQRIGDVISPEFTRQRLAKQLNYAGNPPLWPIDRVVRARMVSLVVLAVIGFLILPLRPILALIAGGAIGIMLPGILIRNLAQKRQSQLQKSLPDVLDALVIGVEAGLGLDAAMAQVAEMLDGPMPSEIRRVLQEMQLGVSRSEALRDLSERSTVLEVKRLCTALVQAGELGISVSGILREHSAEQRVKRRQRAEEQAQKVAVKLLFPVLFCLFPVIFVVVIGPAVLNLLTNF